MSKSTFRRRGRVRGLAVCLTTIALTTSGVAVAPMPAAAAAQQATATTADATPLSVSTALAQAKATGKPVVASAATDPTSETTANPNGTLTRTTTLRPVRTKRDGKWVGLDATLVRNQDGSYSPRTSAASVTLSGGGSGPLAKLDNRGHGIDLTMPMSLPTPAVSGATATYTSVLPDVDLVVTVSPEGDFSHTLVVKTRKAATNPAIAKLRVRTKSRDLKLSADADGKLSAVDAAGRAAYTTPPAVMWDSAKPVAKVREGVAPNVVESVPPGGPKGPGASAHVAPIAVAADKDGFDLVPDAKLLTASDTVYPVMIDPTFVPNPWGANGDWTEIESGKPTYAGWHQTGQAQIGYCAFSGCNDIRITRSFFQWGITPLYDTTVISAQVNVVPEYSYNCHSTVALDWSNGISSATTWNNQPSTFGSLGEKETCLGALGYDVTSKVQYAVANRTGTSTYRLRAVDEGTSGNGWKKFSHTASLSVTWTVPPVTPTGQYSSPVMPCTTTAPYPVIGKTDLYVGVQTHRASDNVAKALTTHFSIKPTTDPNPAPETGGTQKDVDVSAGDWAGTVVAQGGLAAGTYKWTTRVTDGYQTSVWSTECRFTVDGTLPTDLGVPKVTSTDYPENTTGKVVRTTGNFTFNPGGTAQPAAYRYQLNGGVGTTVTATNGVGTASIKPTRAGTNILTVQALSAAGTPSPVKIYHVITAGLTTPDPEGDLNGDGKADVLTVGGSGNTAAGLWMTPGTGNGQLGTPFNIGIKGFDVTTGAPGDWAGALVTTGQFSGNGVQDVLRVSADRVTIYRNPADGSPLDLSSGNVTAQVDVLMDSNWNSMTTAPSQIAAMGHLDQDSDPSGTAFPDLFAVVNYEGTNQLWWFEHWPSGAGYNAAYVLDATIDWSTKTIAGTRDQGKPALLVRDKTTGQVDLYTSNCTANCTGGNWFTSALKTVARPANSALNATNAPLISGGDANNDGNADLWAVNSSGVASYGTGASNHTIAAPVSAGSVLPPANGNLIPLGSVNWLNPQTAKYQTDVYVANPAGQLLVYQPLQSGALGAPKQVGLSSWDKITLFGIADSNHDGYPDLIARDDITCEERVYPGSATGFGLPIVTGGGWCGYTLYGVLDYNGDQHFDVIAVDSAGTQWMYPGDLTGGSGNRVQIGVGFSSDYSPWGIVDFDGDGHKDLITRYTPSNTLKMYPGDSAKIGNGNGTIIGNGFNNTTFAGFLKYSGPTGHNQMLARVGNSLKVYTTNDAGGWIDGLGVTVATGW
ncbi:MAG TPA: hypothetical protein VM677_28675 [Actinokineospora sp.]|nr:hypothetical protein [Actinokineospora sp.]